VKIQSEKMAFINWITRIFKWEKRPEMATEKINKKAWTKQADGTWISDAGKVMQNIEKPVSYDQKAVPPFSSSFKDEKVPETEENIEKPTPLISPQKDYEKLYEVHKKIVLEKDNQLNRLKKELDEKKDTIAELEKLIQKPKDIIIERTEGSTLPDQKQQETIEKFKNEIKEINTRYQSILKEYDERNKIINEKLEKELEIRSNLEKELGEINKEYLKVSQIYKKTVDLLDKDKEKVTSLENELEKQQATNNNLRAEIERKAISINEYETTIKNLNERLEELSGRYREINEKYEDVSEKLEKEKQNAITLEMLILDLDNELGLMNIVRNMDEKPRKMSEIIIST